MSCGPSEKLKELAGKVDALEDKFDSIINESPLGKIQGLKAEAEAEINSVMGKLEGMIPDILADAKAFADQNLHEDVSDMFKLIALGIVQKGPLEAKIVQLKEKWSGVDFGDIGSFDDIENLLRSGAIDLDSICRMIPNIEQDVLGITIKGVPTSFPDIDPVALIKGHKLPELPTPKIVMDIQARKKQINDSFANLELPEFDW